MREWEGTRTKILKRVRVVPIKGQRGKVLREPLGFGFGVLFVPVLWPTVAQDERWGKGLTFYTVSLDRGRWHPRALSVCSGRPRAPGERGESKEVSPRGVSDKSSGLFCEKRHKRCTDKTTKSVLTTWT